MYPVISIVYKDFYVHVRIIKNFVFQEYPVLFKIHVVDSGAKDCYLPTDVEMPLYTEAIDRYG